MTIARLDDYRVESVGPSDALKGGGGDGTSGDMEARVKALENQFAMMDSKLDTILAEVRGAHTDVAYLKGKAESMPSATAFGELKGRVDSLPTTAKAATLLGIAVAATTILLRWEEISKLIGE